MRTLENGFAELIATRYRIVVDPARERYDTFLLYIENIPHEMVLYRRLHHASSLHRFQQEARYEVRPAPGGGVILRYVLTRQRRNIHAWETTDFRVYRFAQQPFIPAFGMLYQDFNDAGLNLLFSQTGVPEGHRIVFEFIDHTATIGAVYYYVLLQVDSRWINNVTPTGYIRVHMVLVQPGDTLYRIGRMHDVPWPALAAYNNLADPHWILPGQVIRIPAG